MFRAAALAGSSCRRHEAARSATAGRHFRLLGSSSLRVSRSIAVMEMRRPEMPRVYVGPSSIAGAGDGVFTREFVARGTPLTWETVKVPTRSDDFFKDWDELRYGTVDATNRCPETGGVAHLINDAAMIQWGGPIIVPGHGDVRSYVKASQANIVFRQWDDRIFIAAAKYDLPPGTELFRSYGPHYWLTYAEQRLLIEMQFVRTDALILLGSQQLAEIRFHDASTRLDVLPFGIQRSWSTTHDSDVSVSTIRRLRRLRLCNDESSSSPILCGATQPGRRLARRLCFPRRPPSPSRIAGG